MTKVASKDETGRRKTKKAGRFPMHEDVGPAKNLAPETKEKRPARYDGTMLLAGVFRIGNKRAF